MASVQTSYTRYHSAGAAGAPADGSTWDGDTWSLIEDGDPIPFGYAVSKDPSGDDICVLGGDLFVGISVRDVTLVHTTPDQYEETDEVGVMVRGDIWVLVEDAVEARQEVKYNTTTGQLGHDGGTVIAGAHFRTSAGAGELAIVRLTGGGDVTT